MGKMWDGGDIAFRTETWAEVLRVLKPGAIIRLAVPDFEALSGVYQQTKDLSKVIGPVYGRWECADRNVEFIYHRTVYDYTSIEEVLTKSQEGKIAQIRGWVAKKRSHKDRIFLVIRDSTGLIQTVIKSGTAPWKEAEKVTTESSIELSGKVRKDVRAPGGYELDVIKLDIVGLAEDWPIARDTSPEFLLDIRHLSVRRSKMQARLKIRSTVFAGIHEYFQSLGYYGHQSPTFTPTPGESGAETFEVKYFGKKA